MFSGYVNFPDSLYAPDGSIRIGYIDGIYDKIINLTKLNKPFIMNVKISENEKYVGFPNVLVTDDGILVMVSSLVLRIDDTDLVTPVK